MIIGIDPDLEKSGVAILGDSLELKNLTFPETVELFKNHQDEIKKVVIEAGWENKKSNFHHRAGQCKSVGERIAKNVGENHATGKNLADMAKYYGLAVVLVKPTRKKQNQMNLTVLRVGRAEQIRNSVMQVY